MQNRLVLRSPLLFILAVMLLVSSCNNRSIMFRTKRHYTFSDLSKIPPTREYKIGLNDQLEISVNPNKGAAMIDAATAVNLVSQTINVIVEFDGTIKLPVLGRIAIKDLTAREAELLLEERFSLFYVDPFVNVKLTNKRVIIFPGSPGTARVMNLANQNTTLTEAIALAGGIPSSGKSHRIKLIRGDIANPQVYLIDLSTIEGMKEGDIVLQGNDIIYVEPINDVIVNFSGRLQSLFILLNLYLIVNSYIK